MTLMQLNYAITVAETQSINAAAKKLYISQPTLSSAIKELEEEIGMQIYNRTNRGISLTKEGEEFVQYARNVLIQYHLLEEKFLGTGHAKKKFSVTMQHSTFAVKFFAELVKELGMEEYEYAIYETKTQDVIRDIRTGKSELGLLYLSAFNQGIYDKIFREANLGFHPIADCSIYVYVRRDHPLAGQQEVSLQELEDYPCLLFEQDQQSSFYFYEEMISAHNYKNVIKTSDRGTTMNLIEGLDAYSVGIGIVTEHQTNEMMTAVRLQSDERIQVGYLTRENAKLSVPGRRFIEKIEKYFGVVPGGE